jgi:Chaperone of endosialidase
VYADISNQNSTLGTHSGLRFSTHYDGGSATPVYKAGIFFRRRGARGIGDVVFSTNTDVGTNTSVDATDSYLKMILTSQGLLGVGTPTPDRLMELEGANDQFMRVTTTTSGIAGIELKRGGGADYRIQANSGLLQFRYGDVDGSTTALYNFSDVAFAPGASALNISLGGPTFRWKDLYLSAYTLNGLGITPTVDNAADLGTSSLRYKDIYASNSVIQTSDLRLKKNIKQLPYGLQEVLQLRPVTFEWKNSKDESIKLGLIAQEIQTLIPEVVNVGDDELKMLGVKYADLIPVLIKAIQEQNKIILDQKKENATLKASVEKLENQHEAVQASLEEIKKIIGLEAKKKP